MVSSYVGRRYGCCSNGGYDVDSEDEDEEVKETVSADVAATGKGGAEGCRLFSTLYCGIRSMMTALRFVTRYCLSQPQILKMNMVNTTAITTVPAIQPTIVKIIV